MREHDLDRDLVFAVGGFVAGIFVTLVGISGCVT